MKEPLKEEIEYDLEESEKKDFNKEIQKEEEKIELNENQNQKEMLITPIDNMEIQGLEDGNSKNKKIIIFFYIILELIFVSCFVIGCAYKIFNIILIIPYLVRIIVYNLSFFNIQNLNSLNNYLLLSKLVPIETLIFFLIFFIKHDEDLLYIIIFILGSISGLFSLIILWIYFYKFLNGCSEFKSIFYLYLELIVILLMIPFLIYTYYSDYNFTSNSPIGFIVQFIESIPIIGFDLILNIINSCSLCHKGKYDNFCLKITMAVMKLLLYILVEIFLYFYF